MFCKNLRRKLASRVSGGSSSSLCLSVARVVKSSMSARECEGSVPEMLWNSQSARRQASRGVTAFFLLYELVCSAGSGELLARMMGE